MVRSHSINVFDFRRLQIYKLFLKPQTLEEEKTFFGGLRVMSEKSYFCKMKDVYARPSKPLWHNLETK